MKNLVGKFFTTGGRIDACVTSTICETIRDPCTYSLKYLKNVPFTIVYTVYQVYENESNVKSTERLSRTYFQNCLSEWNQLDKAIKSSPTISVFKRELVRLVRPTKKSFFGIHDIEGVRLLTRLRVSFSDLREHKFRHKFQCSSPMCICQTGSENNEHFFLHGPRHGNHRRDLLYRISSAVDIDLRSLSSTALCHLLLYADSRFCLDTNRFIIESTLSFVRQPRVSSKFRQTKLFSPPTTPFPVFCSLFMFSFFVHVHCLLFLSGLFSHVNYSVV